MAPSPACRLPACRSTPTGLASMTSGCGKASAVKRSECLRMVEGAAIAAAFPPATGQQVGCCLEL